MRSADRVLVCETPRALPPGWVARPELALFLAAYLLYDAGRWLFAGHAPAARAHADWIIGLERSAHVAVEGSVQRALEGPAVSYLLSTIYLAAQLVVLPGALIWLHRRSRPVYRRLRDTVIATWVIAVPFYALFPVAPPRLAGIGMADTVSQPRGGRADRPLHGLLQPLRRGPEPARRLRLRDRDRRRRGTTRPERGRLRSCGARS